MEEDWDDYVVSSYAFDESLLEHPSLRIKVFTEPTEEWALFILANRTRTGNTIVKQTIYLKTLEIMTEETRFLIDSLVEQLALMAMDEYKLPIPKALELVYNSQLYDKIMDLETGLYYQSARYNYELLRHEVRYGKIV